MKKLLLSSILALAGLGMWAAPSHAWTFGLIPHHCWPCGGCFGCGKCCSTICIHPYNAFSPVASGCMNFDGCNPFCGGAGCCPGGYPGCGPGGYPGYAPGGYAGYCPPAGPGYCPEGCPGSYAGGPGGMAAPGGDCCAQGANPTAQGAPIAVAPAQPPAAGAPIAPPAAYGAAPPLAPSVNPNTGNGR